MKILSNQKGFTLLELLIALTVLSIGLLGLAGLHIAAIQGNVAGFNISTATAVAQERIEQLKVLDASAAALTGGAHAGDGSVIIQGITYNRSYTIQDNTPVNGTSTIVMTVTWADPGTGISRTRSVFTRINKG